MSTTTQANHHAGDQWDRADNKDRADWQKRLNETHMRVDGPIVSVRRNVDGDGTWVAVPISDMGGGC